MRTLPPMVLIAALGPLSAFAGEDVRKVQPSPPKVIEEKCLACHNRKLIDVAVKEGKDIEKILRLKEHKGVALTETERSVMGHFWQKDPFK